MLFDKPKIKKISILGFILLTMVTCQTDENNAIPNVQVNLTLPATDVLQNGVRLRITN